MRPGASLRRSHRLGTAVSPALLAAALATVAALAGCGDAPPPPPTPDPEPPSARAQTDARSELAARAAAAQDHAFTAAYTLAEPGGGERRIEVTMAADRTWRVDVPGAALGGTADVTIAQVGAGIFQCNLGSAANPIDPTCVRIAPRDGRIPAWLDPRVQHPFVDWRDILTDQKVALAVMPSRPLGGARGTCYAVESTSASLNPPLDVGIYCYTEEGLLTAARLGFGTLTLDGEAGAAPQSIDLPGPVVSGEPIGKAAPPPPPKPKPKPSATER